MNRIPSEPRIRTPYTILGIDPGYERCGFAVLEKNDAGKETLLYSDCFKTSTTLPFEERLLLLGQELERLIATYKPALCALEKLFFTNNQKTAMHVAEVRGAFLFIAQKAGCCVCEFSPNEIKVAIAGDGSGDKKQMMRMLPHLIRIEKEIRHDDEYDAIGVALTASATRRVG
jgi:crossover junction endodeoxyribonuclease RuvC